MHNLIRSGALACGVCLLALGGIAFGARGRVASANKKNPDETIALEEESIGAQDLATPTPSPTPSGATGDDTVPGLTSPLSVGDSASIPTPTPAAEATEVPPAMDIGSLTPTRAVSDSSLKPMIDKASNPALAASLRITEKARLEIGDGHLDDAIRDLAYAVSIDPSNSYAYFFLARAYAAKKDYTQAITFFKRAETGIAKNPAWLGETYAFEGLSYEESGQQVEAATAYQKSLAVTPGNLTARVGFTRLSAYLPATPEATPEPTPASDAAQSPPASDAAQSPPAKSAIPPPPELPPPPAASSKLPSLSDLPAPPNPPSISDLPAPAPPPPLPPLPGSGTD